MLGTTRRTVAIASIATVLFAGGAGVAGAATHHGSKSSAATTRPKTTTTHKAATRSSKPGKGRDERESTAMRLRERREEGRESAKAKQREHEPAADKMGAVKSGKKGA